MDEMAQDRNVMEYYMELDAWLLSHRKRLAEEQAKTEARIELLKVDYYDGKLKLNALARDIDRLSLRIRNEMDERVMEGYIAELDTVSRQHRQARELFESLESPPGSPFENTVVVVSQAI